ncbi:hypothetical protein VNO77_18359 [Canavalia gladiata]|uniref:Uncharacterized protein n=1 Tax=Canavalia gladiata TaxID=3824 RepID=A0AAN9QJJ9_CANGL
MTKSLGPCITELLSQLLTIVTELHIYQPSQITPVAETVVESVDELAQIMKETRYVVERIVGSSGSLPCAGQYHWKCYGVTKTSLHVFLDVTEALPQIFQFTAIKRSNEFCCIYTAAFDIVELRDLSGVDALCSGTKRWKLKHTLDDVMEYELLLNSWDFYLVDS